MKFAGSRSARCIELENSKNRKTTLTLFGIYFFILVWIVVWKIAFPRVGDASERFVNLIPFINAATGEWNSVREIVFNVAIFVPFGVYCVLLKPKRSFIRQAVPILLTSLVLETAQYILAVGRSDVSDLISNTLGGVIGILSALLLDKMFGRNAAKVTVIMLAIGTITVAVILAYLFTHIRFR